MIAVWIPVTVVPMSLATVAIAVFITVESRAMTNCPAASVARMIPVPATERWVAVMYPPYPALAASSGRSEQSRR